MLTLIYINYKNKVLNTNTLTERAKFEEQTHKVQLYILFE